MVRVKFTAPVQAVQLQPKSSTRPLVSNVPISVDKETCRETVEQIPQLALQESLAQRQQQSLEMVQIMLHVSFGTLFYLREFLPLSCFDDRDLKQAQRERRFSYREFIHGRPGSENAGADAEHSFGQGKRSQPLKVLVRNSDPKADTILDLLEHGIFDALKRNVLEAVQLTVLVDKDMPTNVLESYTFTFKYTGGPGDMSSRLESLSLHPVGCVADMKTAQSARMGLEMIVRRLITLSAFLPNLPNKRNLGIHLFYTENCPPDYEPPGFSVAADHTIKYPLNNNWMKESQSCGIMDSGYHTVGLKVTSLKWTGPDPGSSELQPEIPPQIEYKDAVPRERDIGFTQEDNMQADLRSEQTGASFEERTQTTQTQERQDISAKQRLQEMIPAASPSQDSDLIPTQPFNANSISTNKGRASQDKAQRMVLSLSKAAEIKQYLCSQKSGFSGSADGSEQGPVKCQCGWDGEEPAMMTTLVLLRRALVIILDEGYPSTVSAFTQKLHCNGHTVIQVTDLLRKQGFLQPTPGYKSKGFLRKGLPKFNIPQSEDVRRRMEREILDPMAKIRHHYDQDTAENMIESSERDNSQQKEYMAKMDVEVSKVLPTRDTGNDNDDQETLGSGDELLELGSSNASLKRRLSRDELADSSQYSSNVSKGESRAGKALGGSQATKPGELSQSPKQIGIRRSPRKRRKISNYAQLIDVGMATSDEDGI
ncbi:DNA binding protein [Monascus purpureus]|uniref:DNA binding protein n=1 Tax=Monascus purpureus TaxID=5098 RepID=A0A507R5C0_MONPU|nr:DNA binding protein [Monascus purpureus]